MNNNMMVTRLPNRQIPRRLIYKQPSLRLIYEDVVTVADFNAYEYRMCDTQTGEYIGRMIAGPMVCNPNKQMSFYPKDEPYKSFFVDDLRAFYKNEGIGNDFLNLAKHESKESGCMGRIHLVASRLFDPTHPPHIFYRKFGFTSNKPRINKHLDWCIKHKKKMYWEFADNLEMYLPINESVKKSIFNRGFLKKFLKRLF